jgi:hypothetical protein
VVDSSRVTTQAVTMIPGMEEASVTVAGEAAAARGSTTVRAMNLDDQALPVATTARSDGSFELTVLAAAMHELRFEMLLTDGRSEPTDLRLSDAFELTESPRLSCLSVSPGLSLAFEAGQARTVELSNDCDGPLSLAVAGSRLEVMAYQLVMEIPAVIEPGQTVAISIQALEAAADADENVLFLTATGDAIEARYPLTLYRLP